jgi:hypothetical protein
MLEYNLTQRERQILVELVELSKNSKDYFEARTLDPSTAAAAGPAREVARLSFGPGAASMELTKRDLRLLKDEGLIHFRWDRPDHGRGRLASLAFDAVGSNFESDNAGNAAAAAIATAASEQAVMADERAIALRFKKISAELSTSPAN